MVTRFFYFFYFFLKKTGECFCSGEGVLWLFNTFTVAHLDECLPPDRRQAEQRNGGESTSESFA